MRQSALAIACLCLVPIAVPARAGDAPAAAGAGTQNPAAAGPGRQHLTLGPEATNAAGEQGRIHTVAAGETLWDISEAYLGTPWLWPSIWKDGSGSSRDAAIQPGEVLWVSSSEIRRLTPADTAQLRVAAPPAAPASMESGAAGQGVPSGAVTGLDHWTSTQALGFLAATRPAWVGTVIGNPSSRAALGTGDPIYIDVGAGQTQVGDRFRIVRAQRDVPDPGTGRMLGTFVEPLGWAEVTVIEGEASTALIRDAIGEIHIGDLLMPSARSSDVTSLQAQSTPADVRGSIVNMIGERVIGGGFDVVYLDRGTEAGLSPGSALEVVRPGARVPDAVRGRPVKVPDTIVGQMVVISAQPSSAAAYVLQSSTDLARGDVFRGAEVR